MSHEGEKLNLIIFLEDLQKLQLEDLQFQNEFLLEIFLSLLRMQKYFKLF